MKNKHHELAYIYRMKSRYMLTGAIVDLRLDPGAGSRIDSRILVICPNEVQY
jgi:hypothetical protein